MGVIMDYTNHLIVEIVGFFNLTLQIFLGRDTDGTSIGGQSWYDMTLAVSTTDENHIYVGGICLWESTDGGITWNIEGASGNGSNYSYMHVDHHAAEFNPIK